MTDWVARLGARHDFTRRFVAGETLGQALETIAPLARAGQRVILNHLGENVATPAEARGARDSYIRMLRSLPDAGIDGNIAVKLTQLGLDLDRELCLGLTHEIAAAAAAMRNTIEIDMEGSACTDSTLRIFEEVQRQHGNAGVALQAYLRRSQSDLQRLASLNPPLNPKIRLVKGAYREPASVAFQKKSEVDANYRRLLDRMLELSGPVVAIATHDPALVDYAFAKIRELGLPSSPIRIPDASGHPARLATKSDFAGPSISRVRPLWLGLGALFHAPPFGAARQFDFRDAKLVGGTQTLGIKAAAGALYFVGLTAHAFAKRHRGP